MCSKARHTVPTKPARWRTAVAAAVVVGWTPAGTPTTTASRACTRCQRRSRSPALPAARQRQVVSTQNSCRLCRRHTGWRCTHLPRRVTAQAHSGQGRRACAAPAATAAPGRHRGRAGAGRRDWGAGWGRRWGRRRGRGRALHSGRRRRGCQHWRRRRRRRRTRWRRWGRWGATRAARPPPAVFANADKPGRAADALRAAWRQAGNWQQR